MVELLNIDCIEYMKDIPDKFFDLAIVDPPYGIGEHGGKLRGGIQGRKKGFKEIIRYENKGWDNKTPTDKFFLELKRVSVNQIIWGANHFGNMPPSPCWIVWDKKITDNSDFADCELAWTSFKTTVRKFTYGWLGLEYVNNIEREKKIHPTQKPVKLYRWLLKNYAKPGDKIFDSHGGSMSSAIACHNMGFDMVLCEIDKDYYDAGVKRYNDEIKQLKLL